MVKVRFAAISALLSMGCYTADTAERSGETVSQPQESVRDSSGVRIVEHVLGAPNGLQVRVPVLDTIPTFVADRIPRSESAELHRVTAGAFLHDGRFVVGHGSLNELILFDPKNGFVRSMGRKGSGPTEFQSITGIWSLSNDEIAVYDENQRRIVVLDTLGHFVRLTVLSGRIAGDTSYRLWRTFGVSASGVSLLWMDRNDGTTSGMSRPKMQLAAADTVGRVTRAGIERPGLERYVMPPQRNGGFSYGRSPFARAPVATMCGELVAVADNAAYEIVIAPLTFVHQTIIRAPVLARVAEDRDYLDAIRLQFGAEFEVTDDMIAPARMMTPSGLLPVIQALHCDEAYNIWVEESAFGAGKLRRVVAYRPDGTMKNSIMIPAGLRILAVSSDAVLVLQLDENGREFVQILRIPSGLLKK